LITIRPARNDDNAELLALETICPEGTDLVLQFDRSPDYFFRSKFYDKFECYVAEEDGKIVGTVAATISHFNVGAEPLNGIYIRDLRVHPEFRRRNIGSDLVQHAMIEEQNADLAYALVMEGNTPSSELFQSLGYDRVRDFIFWTVPIYKRRTTMDGTIREMTAEDQPAVADLMNDYYQDHDFYEGETEDKFANRMALLRKCGLRNMLVAESERRIVACAGLWDYSSILRPSILRLTVKLRILSSVLSFLSLFTYTPKLPAVGELFKLSYVIDFANAKGSLSQVENLIKHCLDLARSYGSHFLCFPLDASDPRRKLISKHHAIPVNYHLYGKGLKRNVTWHSSAVSYADPLDF